MSKWCFFCEISNNPDTCIAIHMHIIYSLSMVMYNHLQSEQRTIIVAKSNHLQPEQ